MAEISEKIDLILKNRIESLKIVKKTKENIEKSRACVDSLEFIQRSIRSQRSEFYSLVRFDADIADEIQSISLTDYKNLYRDYSFLLGQLEQRFSRENLYLSFVGKAGQGKSLVLQKISGLKNDVIPSADGSDCTGAKSIITNRQQTTHGEITFFTEQELVEIINKYLVAILHNNSENIYDIHEIPRIDILGIKRDILQEEAKERNYAEHLQKYVQNFREYCDDLGTVKQVDARDIEQYVSQYSCKDVTKKYYKYLAVKQANIVCTFPHQDLGKVVLLDTIGMGATSLGVEESMLKTIGENSDAIVLMFRPDSLRPRISSDEIDILTKITDRISPEYSKNLLFWVINRVEQGKGQNTALIPEIENTIRNSNYAIADVYSVNCMSEEDVYANLMLPMLSDVTENMAQVDRLLMSRTVECAKSLQKAFLEIQESIKYVFPPSVNGDIVKQLTPKIRKTIDSNSADIRDLFLTTGHYGSLRKVPCEFLRVEVENVIKDINSYIPNRNTILRLLRSSRNQHDVLRECSDYMRQDIISDFLRIDETLITLVSAMKNDILSIMTNENQGRLGCLCPYNPSAQTPEEWIEKFLEGTDCKNNYPYIYKAFKDLAMFTLSVKGFMIFEVRECLDELDFSTMTRPPKLPDGAENPEICAEEIIDILEEVAYNVTDTLRKNLKYLYMVPNKALFAAVKDFHDIISYAGKGVGDYRDTVKDQWEALYSTWITSFFPMECKNSKTMKLIAEKWEELIKQFKEIDDATFVIG